MNRVPSPILNNQTPYFLLHNQNADMHQLKVFGSLAYASTLQAHRVKLASRARKCIFLGYKSGMKGVILLDTHSKEIFVSRNVTHHESIFPYKNNPSNVSWEYHTHLAQDYDIAPVIETPPSETVSDPFNSTSNSTNEPSSSTSIPNPPLPSPPVIHKSTRVKSAPGYLKDYICNNSSISSSKSVNSGISYPITDFHSFDHLSSSHRVFSISITQSTEPKTYKEACQSEHWLKAMNDELKALTANGTWSIVDLPPNVKPIGSKWVYRVKHKADGSIERYKARLVAKGYNQIEGLYIFLHFLSCC